MALFESAQPIYLSKLLTLHLCFAWKCELYFNRYTRNPRFLEREKYDRQSSSRLPARSWGVSNFLNCLTRFCGDNSLKSVTPSHNHPFLTVSLQLSSVMSEYGCLQSCPFHGPYIFLLLWMVSGLTISGIEHPSSQASPAKTKASTRRLEDIGTI